MGLVYSNIQAESLKVHQQAKVYDRLRIYTSGTIPLTVRMCLLEIDNISWFRNSYIAGR